MKSKILEDEIVALQEIFYKEFAVSEKDSEFVEVTILINPDSGFDKPEDLLICFQLRLLCPPEYPEKPPNVYIEEVRGFDDSYVDQIRATLESLIAESLDHPMLYELILKAKEFCADNCPHGLCPICRSEFQCREDVFRTPRYHYFHRRCVAQYMAVKRAQFEEELQEILRKDPHRPEASRPKLEIPCPTCQAPDDHIVYEESLVQQFAPSFSSWSSSPVNEWADSEMNWIPESWLQMREELAARQRRQQEIVALEKVKSVVTPGNGESSEPSTEVVTLDSPELLTENVACLNVTEASAKIPHPHRSRGQGYHKVTRSDHYNQSMEGHPRHHSHNHYPSHSQSYHYQGGCYPRRGRGRGHYQGHYQGHAPPGKQNHLPGGSGARKQRSCHLSPEDYDDNDVNDL